MPITAEPTHNTDAERSVLGALLLDSDAVHSVMPKLSADDFFDPVYRSIYSAIQDLYSDGVTIDFVTVSDRLRDNTMLQKIGGSAFLAELPVETPTSSNVEQYADIVSARSLRRQILKLSKEASELAEDEAKTSACLLYTSPSPRDGLLSRMPSSA